jgi:hypothetical protein
MEQPAEPSQAAAGDDNDEGAVEEEDFESALDDAFQKMDEGAAEEAEPGAAPADASAAPAYIGPALPPGGMSAIHVQGSEQRRKRNLAAATWLPLRLDGPGLPGAVKRPYRFP